MYLIRNWKPDSGVVVWQIVSSKINFSEFEEAILTFFDDYKKDKEKELEDMKEK